MAWTELLWVAAALLALLYLFVTSNNKFFVEKRLPYRRPIPLLGNMGPLVFKKKNLALLSQEFYHQFKSFGMGGIFHFRKPVLVICEPEVVRQLCIREHENFVDDNAVATEDGDGLFHKSILAHSGARWRDLRATLSPAFSSGRLAAMVPLVGKCAQRLVLQLGEACVNHVAGGGADEPLAVELREVMARAVGEATAAAAFGVGGSGSGGAGVQELLAAGAEAADPRGRRALYTLAHALAPGLAEVLDMQIVRPETQEYFRSLVHAAVRAHEVGTPAAGAGAEAERADALHLLVAGRQGNLRSLDTDEELAARAPLHSGAHKAQNIVAQLSDDDITAQVLLFFLSGFETTCTLLSFLGYVLAVHPHVQERARREVEEALEDGHTLTYEALKKMKYLDMVISETLRMYPPTPVAARKCTHTFAVLGTKKRSGFVVRPGDTLWLPIYALHNDPELFPDPDKFDPERFSQANEPHAVPFSYLPFGAGPRSCIGMQFAMMEVKVITAYLLSRFHIKAIDKTPVPLKLTKGSCQMTTDEGFWVGLEPRTAARHIQV
ncbi:hypothetical protein R5R35_014078 [Gryllus longicercus]|uniref:Cytochrome P450 n=1 Tax=Gryllus longicercus TaxID=2509291 RepID=A0AAN9UZW0_9ORTH